MRRSASSTTPRRSTSSSTTSCRLPNRRPSPPTPTVSTPTRPWPTPRRTTNRRWSPPSSGRSVRRWGSRARTVRHRGSRWTASPSGSTSPASSAPAVAASSPIWPPCSTSRPTSPRRAPQPGQRGDVGVQRHQLDRGPDRPDHRPRHLRHRPGAHQPDPVQAERLRFLTVRGRRPRGGEAVAHARRGVGHHHRRGGGRGPRDEPAAHVRRQGRPDPPERREPAAAAGIEVQDLLPRGVQRLRGGTVAVRRRACPAVGRAAGGILDAECQR